MLCVIARLDEQAVSLLQELQSAAVQWGAAPRRIHGHITLVSYMGEDEQAFLAHCKQILRTTDMFSVEYEALTVLRETDIIVASPRKTDQLRELHRSLGSGYWERLDRWSQKEIWRPHTTLVYGLDLNLDQLCRLMWDRFHPFAAWVTKIEFSRVTADGYEIVDFIDLKSGEAKWK